MSDDAPLVRRAWDAGLQPERTSLAWNRTGLALVVNALLVLRAGWASGRFALVVVAAALLIAAGSTVFYGAWRQRHLSTGLGMTAPPALAVAATATITLVACVAGLVSMLGPSNAR
jgi:uncharacterized membrane protein YidH (DUF202 family)